MIQRVFYCDLGSKPESIAAPDLDAREHLALWPLVALFLAMGVASPLWMRAIDTFGAPIAGAHRQLGATEARCDARPCSVDLATTAAKEAR